ncbi:MAG: hypothetical protein OEY25_09745 [Candidatus Aminicenantes bacterium]|nr:hypothetical protein [Candidatus Aminicenantes bacterium]MDH5706115.1 hypothetical protein [Candidatus Aminicenantes bacterium]
MYSIIFIVSILTLLLTLSIHRFLETKSRAPGASGAPSSGYFSWALRRVLFSVKRLKQSYQKWIIKRYKAGERWVFICLALTYGYLAASGFVFSLAGIRLQGVFLLLHMLLGGLFAVCLSLAVVFRARFYRFDTQPSASSRKRLSILLFWVFMASGCLLIATALCLMLPIFSLRTQLDIFAIHRYGALASLLSAISFISFSRVDDS